jgi:hypothetical protein
LTKLHIICKEEDVIMLRIRFDVMKVIIEFVMNCAVFSILGKSGDIL